METHIEGGSESNAEPQNCEPFHGIDLESHWSCGIANYRYILPVTVLMAKQMAIDNTESIERESPILMSIGSLRQHPHPRFFLDPKPEVSRPSAKKMLQGRGIVHRVDRAPIESRTHSTLPRSSDNHATSISAD